MGMFMNDPLALAKRADEPLYVNPKARGRQHAIQRTIPILAVTEDGIFKIAPDKFSKSYELQDGEADEEPPSEPSHHLMLHCARRVFGKPKMSATASAPMAEMAFAGMTAEKRSLKDMVSQTAETFQESLLRWIDERGMKDPEVYKKANLDKKLFSKIKKNKDYHPSKNTALALSIALHLNLDETKDLSRLCILSE